MSPVLTRPLIASVASVASRAVILALIFGSNGAAAQHAHAPANGGQIQSIGKFEGELVVKGGRVTLYVVDESERKVDASKFTASAAVLGKGNEIKTIEMTPAGENTLVGAIAEPIQGKFRATVMLRLAGSEVGKGRFNLDPQ